MLQNGQPRRNIRSSRAWQCVKRPEKASDGGLGREFDYREIVERHFGKHTGLRHSAKACPKGTYWRWKPAAERAVVKSTPVKPSRSGEIGRRQKSRRFRQREARQ